VRPWNAPPVTLSYANLETRDGSEAWSGSGFTGTDIHIDFALALARSQLRESSCSHTSRVICPRTYHGNRYGLKIKRAMFFRFSDPSNNVSPKACGRRYENTSHATRAKYSLSVS